MFKRLFGSLLPSKKSFLDRFDNEIAEIERLEAEFMHLTDDQLKDVARSLKNEAIAGAELSGELRNKSFALIKVASQRVTGRIPHKVQVLAGLALSTGKIAEMRTGEGKTLVAAMPSFLFALKGRGVHVVTVNDYLAQRDAADIGRIHEFLGLTVGVVVGGMDDFSRKAAYACDITYATNSEIGFDYLRDNLRLEASQMVQRGHHYAIVDEADSILIDEARTPLIISSADEGKLGLYPVIDQIVKGLPDGSYKVDPKDQSVILNEDGADYVDERLEVTGITTRENKLHNGADLSISRALDAALKAHKIFFRDKDYVVHDGKVMIVDSFTGRLQPDRRFSDGIHQALEAKEGVEINAETVTLTSITYQNLFRMYGLLSGMTGTADTERDELEAVYKIETVVIPTNKPVQRVDEDDQVYLSEKSKIAAVIKTVVEANGRGQPVLIGTSSIEKSELIAHHLTKAGFRRLSGAPDEATERAFSVLNARNHANEAAIIAQAGLPGAITVATNMAGRGTDIQLGGHNAGEGESNLTAEAVVSAGGLLVIGTERNDSRRVDNQLRGRSGRQGDPGRTIFFVSLEDEIIQTYGKAVVGIARGLGLTDDAVVAHPIISKSIQQAQLRVEARNREIRLNVMKYDDIINEQRKAIREMRLDYMATDDLREVVDEMRSEAVSYLCDNYVPDDLYPDEWDGEGLQDDLITYLGLELDIPAWLNEDGIRSPEVKARIMDTIRLRRQEVERVIGEDQIIVAEKTALMLALDKVWRKHNEELEELKASVGLRTVGQRDPIVEFRTDAFAMFQATIKEIGIEAAGNSMRIRPVMQVAI